VLRIVERDIGRDMLQ